MDRMIRDKWRKQLLYDLHGDILEVGIGTGSNLPYYPDHIQLTGIEFIKGMLSHARKQARQISFPLNLLEMDAQELFFENNTFDFIVLTCVDYSVTDSIQGLKEIRRGSKAGGRILLLELTPCDNPILGEARDVRNRILVGTYGANLIRRTIQNIERAGLKVENEVHLLVS